MPRLMVRRTSGQSLQQPWSKGRAMNSLVTGCGCWRNRRHSRWSRSSALGIGANAAIFQLIDAVRLRTLPVKCNGSYCAFTFPLWHWHWHSTLRSSSFAIRIPLSEFAKLALPVPRTLVMFSRRDWALVRSHPACELPIVEYRFLSFRCLNSGFALYRRRFRNSLYLKSLCRPSGGCSCPAATPFLYLLWLFCGLGHRLTRGPDLATTHLIDVLHRRRSPHEGQSNQFILFMLFEPTQLPAGIWAGHAGTPRGYSCALGTNKSLLRENTCQAEKDPVQWGPWIAGSVR